MKRFGILFVAILVIGYLAHAVLADDTAVTEISDGAPVEPAEVVVEPVVETVVETVVEQPQMEATTVPAPMISTIVPPEIAPAIMGSVALTANTPRAEMNTSFNVTVMAQDMQNVANTSITCQSNPAILRGEAATLGDGLAAAQAGLTDLGFQADGSWTVNIDAMNNVSNSTGIWWQMRYQVVGVGQDMVTCRVSATHMDGSAFLLTADVVGVSVEGFDNAPSADAVAPEVLEVIEEPPAGAVEIAPVEEVAPVTVDTTTIETVTEDVSVMLADVSGQVLSANSLVGATVTLAGNGMQQIATVQADGLFTLRVPTGEYRLIVTAANHTPYIAPIIVTDTNYVIPAITLEMSQTEAEEVDDTVDMGDVQLVIENFGLAVPPAPATLDLNADSQIDIYDLSILGANLNLAGN